MPTAYRSLVPLLSSYGVLLLANGLFNTAISIRSKFEDFSNSIIGIILAGYFVGLLLSTLYAARVVASIGHIRSFAMFASIASTVAITHLLWVDVIFWAFLRIVSGFCMGGMIVVTEGWLNENAENHNRGKILSIYTVTTFACIGSAQLFMLFVNPNGFKLFVLISILYSYALVPILLTQSQTPPPTKPIRPDVKRLYQTSPVGMLGSFVVGFINGIFYSLTPVYTSSIGLDVEQTALFMALSITSGMLLQIPLGRISDRIDRRWVIVFSCAMTVVACLLLTIANSNHMILLYLAGLFYGCVAFSINSLCVAHVNDLTPADERTQTASGLLMFYGIGAVIGPFISGFVMQVNERYIFTLMAGITLLFVLYTVGRLFIKPRPHQAKRKFIPFTTQSPARWLIFTSKKPPKS